AKQKKSKEAILLYSKLVDDGLAENADLLALARLHDASGQYQKSETVLQMLLKNAPADTDAMHLLITAAEKLGRHDAAREYRKRLDLVAPDKRCN
ncbi:MAG TPA: tetratricopeptide repeat protein, partial [Acidobacteriota bacterium]|nr:tetratricopeptide repeat protein [Acidobacteriota bacterium]